MTKKHKTKEFLTIAGSIFTFFIIVSILSGGEIGNTLKGEFGYFGWILALIINSLILSAIFVYLLRPLGRFFKKKFVVEDKESISQKEVFKEMFFRDKNEKTK